LVKEFEQGDEVKTALGRYRVIEDKIEWIDSMCSSKDQFKIEGYQLTLMVINDSCNKENIGSKLVFSFVKK